MPRIAICSLTMLTVLATFQPALAQDKHRPRNPRDQIYVFDDDPLDAVGLQERGTRVRVRQDAGRPVLIRPRTHFVRELTRSVENL